MVIIKLNSKQQTQLLMLRIKKSILALFILDNPKKYIRDSNEAINIGRNKSVINNERE